MPDTTTINGYPHYMLNFPKKLYAQSTKRRIFNYAKMDSQHQKYAFNYYNVLHYF